MAIVEKLVFVQFGERYNLSIETNVALNHNINMEQIGTIMLKEQDNVVINVA